MTRQGGTSSGVSPLHQILRGRFERELGQEIPGKDPRQQFC